MFDGISLVFTICQLLPRFCWIALNSLDSRLWIWLKVISTNSMWMCKKPTGNSGNKSLARSHISLVATFFVLIVHNFFLSLDSFLSILKYIHVYLLNIYRISFLSKIYNICWCFELCIYLSSHIVCCRCCCCLLTPSYWCYNLLSTISFSVFLHHHHHPDFSISLFMLYYVCILLLLFIRLIDLDLSVIIANNFYKHHY